MTQYADADELLAMYTFDDDGELSDLNERGHVPLPVIRENPVIAWLPMPELPKEEHHE